MTLPLAIAAALVATSPVAGPEIITAQSLDATLLCFRSALGKTGRLVTINTAGGALLDFAFDTVAADGKPATAHVAFTIDDRGPARHVSATAADPADAPLAGQLLLQTAKTCLTEPAVLQ